MSSSDAPLASHGSAKGPVSGASSTSKTSTAPSTDPCKDPRQSLPLARTPAPSSIPTPSAPRGDIKAMSRQSPSDKGTGKAIQDATPPANDGDRRKPVAPSSRAWSDGSRSSPAYEPYHDTNPYSSLDQECTVDELRRMLEDAEEDKRRMRSDMVKLERERDASAEEASARLDSLTQEQASADERNLQSLKALADAHTKLDKTQNDLAFSEKATASMQETMDLVIAAADDDQSHLRSELQAERSQHALLTEQVAAQRQGFEDREQHAKRRHQELDEREHALDEQMRHLEQRAATQPTLNAAAPAYTPSFSRSSSFIADARPRGPWGTQHGEWHGGRDDSTEAERVASSCKYEAQMEEQQRAQQARASPTASSSGVGVLPGVHAVQGAHTNALFANVFARTAPTPSRPEETPVHHPPAPSPPLPSPRHPPSTPDRYGRFGNETMKREPPVSRDNHQHPGHDSYHVYSLQPTASPSRDPQRDTEPSNARQPLPKVDVPPEPKLKSHPTGDDVYCPVFMDKWAKESLNFLKKQRLWAFWLQTSMSPTVEQNALTVQMAANTISAHAMLYAAVFDCIPDTPEFKTIRDKIADEALVANCSHPDGCIAFFAMINRDVSAAKDSPRVSHAISFFAASNEPIKSNISPSEFITREGKCDNLLARCYGFIDVSSHDRAVMLKCAFPSQLRSRINDEFADMVRADHGKIRDYAAFRAAAKLILAGSRDDQRLRDLGLRLSESTSDLDGSMALRAAVQSPPVDLHQAPTPSASSSGLSDREHESNVHSPLHASRAQTPPLDPDEAFDMELPDVIRHAADCLCQPWACAARAAIGTSSEKDICLVCGKGGHGKGIDIFRNEKCFAAIDGPGVDNPALLKFSPPAQIAAHQRHSRVLTKFVAMKCPKEGLVMTGGLVDTESQHRRSSATRNSHSARPATSFSPVPTRPPTPTMAAAVALQQESEVEASPSVVDDDSTDIDDDEQQFYHPLADLAVRPAIFHLQPVSVDVQPVSVDVSVDPPSQTSSDTSHEAAGLSDLEPMDSSDSDIGSPGLLQSFDSLSSTPLTQRSSAAPASTDSPDSDNQSAVSPVLASRGDSGATQGRFRGDSGATQGRHSHVRPV